MADWRKCERIAQEVLDKNKDAVVDSVDVIKIAQKAGIQIKPQHFASDFQYISGFLKKEADGTLPVIYVNVDEDARRQTFTIAHELGHYFLEHSPNEWGINPRDAVYFEEKDEAEREADYFAAYLLMPEDQIDKVKREYHLKNSDYAILAEMFGVSNTAMRNRLSFLDKKNVRKG